MKKYNFTKEQREEYDFICNEQLDYMTDTYYAPDFVEIHGSMGGDDLVFRVYKNGMVAER